MKRLVLKPEGWPIQLGDCRPGLFTFNGEVCLKSEYYTDGNMDAYCDSGESFWGGVTDESGRRGLMVQPVIAVWETEE